MKNLAFRDRTEFKPWIPSKDPVPKVVLYRVIGVAMVLWLFALTCLIVSALYLSKDGTASTYITIVAATVPSLPFMVGTILILKWNALAFRFVGKLPWPVTPLTSGAREEAQATRMT